MKSILQSLSKDECFRIANGQQTITSVNRVPKTETPFKVYVYMKMGNVPKMVTTKDGKTMSIYEFEPMLLSGRVIMEYICDSVEGNTLHISDLKIYDKPRELCEFTAPCKQHKTKPDESCKGCPYIFKGMTSGKLTCDRSLTRAPQSWQYVEEV